jgi:hypothetical protein
MRQPCRSRPCDDFVDVQQYEHGPSRIYKGLQTKILQYYPRMSGTKKRGLIVHVEGMAATCIGQGAHTPNVPPGWMTRVVQDESDVYRSN